MCMITTRSGARACPAKTVKIRQNGWMLDGNYLIFRGETVARKQRRQFEEK